VVGIYLCFQLLITVITVKLIEISIIRFITGMDRWCRVCAVLAEDLDKLQEMKIKLQARVPPLAFAGLRGSPHMPRGGARLKFHRGHIYQMMGSSKHY